MECEGVNRMKKLWIILCMLFIFVLWTGCQRQEAAEEKPQQGIKQEEQEEKMSTGEELVREVHENIGAILEKERRIEDIFMGAGLATAPNAPYEPDENGQCFVPVTDEEVNTLQALRDLTEEVFTPEYAQQQFYQGSFEGSYPRYREEDGKLCIDIGVGGALDKEWAPDTLDIVKGEGNRITVTVDYMNYQSLRRSQIQFVKTEEGLRIEAMEEVGL